MKWLILGEYIRRRALDRPGKSRVGGLQKDLATKFQQKRDAIDQVLVEIMAAI